MCRSNWNVLLHVAVAIGLVWSRVKGDGNEYKHGNLIYGCEFFLFSLTNNYKQ